MNLDNNPSWALPPDMAELVAEGAGEVIRDILLMFLENTELSFQQVAAAIESNAAPLVQRLGHGLKGGCAQVGALPLSRIAAGWEAPGATPEEWRRLYARFRDEFARVRSLVLAHPVMAGA